MASGYDGNPYAHEQGPADDESDDIANGIELAIEQIEEAMGEWGGVKPPNLPESMRFLHEAVDTLQDTLTAYRRLFEPTGPDKEGNECRFCSNWVDVERGLDTCAACLNKH